VTNPLYKNDYLLDTQTGYLICILVSDIQVFFSIILLLFYVLKLHLSEIFADFVLD